MDNGGSNEQPGIASSTPARSGLVGRWIVVTVLLLLLVATGILAYLGWTSAGNIEVPASAYVAMLIARSYSVVTTLQRSVAAIEDRLRLAGVAGRCASVRASGMSTLDIDADPRGAIRGIVEEARIAVTQDHAGAICLGCAGMAGLEEAITTELGVPVVDGIGAAVRLAEAIVGLSLKTSKLCTYAAPEPKVITGWPLSQLLGSRAGSGS